MSKSYRFHILRQRRHKVQLFSGDRMMEGQFPGMECLTPDEFHIRIIKVISDEGIAQIFHMNPYLMGAAGL